MKRVYFVLVVVLSGSLVVSGCMGIQSSYDLDAKWGAPAKTSFEPTYADSMTIVEAREVLDQEVKVEATNRIVSGLVMPSNVDEFSLDNPFASGMIVTTPQVKVAGMDMNPVSDMSDKELLEYFENNAMDFAGQMFSDDLSLKVEDIEKVREVDFPDKYRSSEEDVAAPDELSIVKVEYEEPDLTEIGFDGIIIEKMANKFLTGEAMVVLGRGSHNEDRLIRALVLTPTENYELKDWFYRFFVTKHPSEKPEDVNDLQDILSSTKIDID